MTNESQGLGNMVAPAQQSAQQPSMEQQIQEIVALLEQGISPQELISKGVSKELVEAALQMMSAQREQPAPTEEAGLANALMAQGRV